MFKNYLMSNINEKKTKGFTQKTMDIVKKGNKKITLNEVKQMAKDFDKLATKDHGKYIIRARNVYRDNITVRDFNGKYYDDDDDYYDDRGYDQGKFESFQKIQVYFVK
jgi:hypothetical protein